MNAVILYDDVDAASQANAMLERAAHRADEALAWVVKPWRFDLLTQPPVADEALEDAAGAHLIVLAVRNRADMAPWVLDWLERWATHRQVEEAALALWDGGNGDALAETATLELSQFAERQGLSLLLDGALPGENEAESFARRLEDRATFQSSTLLDILEQPSHQDYREWGIND